MVRDSSISFISNDNSYHKSSLMSISMMHDFIFGQYPIKTYGYDEIDCLSTISNE